MGQLCFITNWGKCYYKLGQLIYYKMGQALLQIWAAITNWCKLYNKLGQLLQIEAIITNWGITTLAPWKISLHSYDFFIGFSIILYSLCKIYLLDTQNYILQKFCSFISFATKYSIYNAMDSFLCSLHHQKVIFSFT